MRRRKNPAAITVYNPLVLAEVPILLSIIYVILLELFSTNEAPEKPAVWRDKQLDSDALAMLCCCMW